MSHPNKGKTDPPEGMYYTHTSSHWQTPETYLKFLELAIVPYRLHKIGELGLKDDQWMLLRHDLHYSHKTSEICKYLMDNHIIPLFIPAGCTDTFQECDVIVNKPFKSAIRVCFQDFLVTQHDAYLIAHELPNGPTDFIIDMKESTMNPQVPTFVSAAINTLRSPVLKEAIRKCFLEAGCLGEAMLPATYERALTMNYIQQIVIAGVVPVPEEEEAEENVGGGDAAIADGEGGADDADDLAEGVDDLDITDVANSDDTNSADSSIATSSQPTSNGKVVIEGPRPRPPIDKAADLTIAATTGGLTASTAAAAAVRHPRAPRAAGGRAAPAGRGHAPISTAPKAAAPAPATAATIPTSTATPAATTCNSGSKHSYDEIDDMFEINGSVKPFKKGDFCFIPAAPSGKCGYVVLAYLLGMPLMDTLNMLLSLHTLDSEDRERVEGALIAEQNVKKSLQFRFWFSSDMLEALCREKGINVLVLNTQYSVQAGAHKRANSRTFFMLFSGAHYSGLQVINPESVRATLQMRFPDKAAPGAAVPPAVAAVPPAVAAAPTVTAAPTDTDDGDVDTDTDTAAAVAAASSNKRVRYSNSLHGAVRGSKYSVRT